MALLSSPLDCHTLSSMDTLISSVFTPHYNSSSGCPSELSFSHAISSAPLWAFQKTLKSRRVIPSLNIYAVTSSSPQDTDVPRRSPHRLLKELEEMKSREQYSRKVKDKMPPKTSILKTPMDDQRLARRFLKSPQLSLKSFPLLSSCLPASPLSDIDKAWMEDNLLEAKQALGYPLETLSSFDEDSPAAHFDTLLYLAFQHEDSERAKNSRYVRIGHSRLSFLGQFVQSLALAEFFLQRYPREGPACLRERAFGMTNKRVLPYWIKVASLDNLIFPCDDITRMKRHEREPAIKQVFQALMGAIYLCFGMAEIYRVVFEAFGMDPDAEDCQPKERRQLEDIDYVSSEYEGKQLTWQEMVAYKRPVDALFAHPRLFRACVPPGMHKFRGNIWEVNDLPHVFHGLGYPLPMSDTIPQATEARNIELGLGLQLCFLHPSKYKFEHPRFCYERLEYLGQNIQDFAEGISIMLGGIYYIKRDIMNVVSIFHEHEEEDMGKKQKKLLHDVTRLYQRDQSSKGRQVTFQNGEAEAEAEDEECVAISEDRIRTDVRKEKNHKKTKTKMYKNVSLLVYDEDIISVQENIITNRRKKQKNYHYEKIMDNSEGPSEKSKGSREIITPRADLEDGVMKTKENSI